MTGRQAAPTAWKGRQVEVLTGPGYGRGWWYFAGDLAARNATAERMGQSAPYRRTDRYLTHPVYGEVAGRVWEDSPAQRRSAQPSARRAVA